MRLPLLLSDDAGCRHSLRGRRVRTLADTLLVFLSISCLVLVLHIARECLQGSAVAHERNVLEGALKVRVFWIRHGLSCGNVLDKCNVKPSSSSELLTRLQASVNALPQYVLGSLRNLSLNEAYGVKPSVHPGRADCTVKLEEIPWAGGQTRSHGRITQLHHLYLDSPLTDCARHQSLNAGRTFIRWLVEQNIRLDFIGSSFLIRAMQTGYHMFVAPCNGNSSTECSSVINQTLQVTPIPYITERAGNGDYTIQADNFPAPSEEQYSSMMRTYGRTIVDDAYGKSWPRMAQQFEKFKAFLAMVLVPKLATVQLDAPPLDVFQAALEASLPETAHYGERKESSTRVSWGSGEYQTGPSFTREDYETLVAPEVNIALVGHGQMIADWCLSSPSNNEVLEKLFILHAPVPGTMPRQTTMRELIGKCEVVMRPPSLHSSVADLSTADVESCESTFDIANLLCLGDATSVKETPCMQHGSESAFRIQRMFAEHVRR